MPQQEPIQLTPRSRIILKKLIVAQLIRISLLVVNPVVHYQVQITSLGPILTHINPIQTLSPSFFNIYSPCLGLQKCLLHVFQQIFCVYFLSVPHTLNVPPHPLPNFVILMFGEYERDEYSSVSKLIEHELDDLS
jgi:hypothetical protein